LVAEGDRVGAFDFDAASPHPALRFAQSHPPLSGEG
jgi:hypothetical protein